MIYVIGDGITDEYIYGSYTKISPETPIPIFRQERVETKEGGALNVVNNLKALGSSVFADCGKNSKKVRYVVDNRIVFRSDEEKYVINSRESYQFNNTNWVVISDYGKGHIHLPETIITSAKKAGVKVVVDPKRELYKFLNADIVKLNLKEFKDFTGYDDLERCEIVRRSLDIEAIVVTLGGEGVYISSKDFTGFLSSSFVQVSDVTGAGDVFLASMVHYLDRNFSLVDACIKANQLASISVSKMGTYVLQPEDIKQVKTVFTNGCFDILHKGHIDYLKKSKELGGKLIVGLNSDKSVKKIKGACRPINKEEARKEVLENIGCVDEVIIFDEETPYELIKQIKPDVITKGGDYTTETVIGNDLAEVVIIPFVEGYSTTSILNKRREINTAL